MSGAYPSPTYDVIDAIDGVFQTLAVSGLANLGTADIAVAVATTLESSNALLTGGSITGMPTPVNPSDVATKSYADAAIQGLQVKPTAALATAAALPTNVYVNGVAGVGATLTGTATGTLTVDGVLTTLGQLILVRSEVASANNGLYTVTTAGAVGVAYVLTRSVDMQTASEFSGAMVPVGSGGTANANTLWLANPTTPVTVGSTAIPFTELNAPPTAGAGVAINNGTVTINGSATVTATAGATLTLAPISGTTDILINLPASGGTVTLAYSGAFPRQRMEVDWKQGATASVVVLNVGTVAGFEFGTLPTAITATATAGAIDMMICIAPAAGYTRVCGYNPGFTA